MRIRVHTTSVKFSSESGMCTSVFCLCKVYKHGLLQHCRETGLKKRNQAQDKDIRKGSMTHQDEGRIEVTIYEDDVVLRRTSHVISGIREISIHTNDFITSIFLVCMCSDDDSSNSKRSNNNNNMSDSSCNRETKVEI